VLVVDDEAAGLLAMKSVLESSDRRLVLARSGRDALRFMLTEDFAVVLLDVRMPDIDGLETARIIRSRPRSAATPIIFLTAASGDDDQVSLGYEAGAVDYVLKPVNPTILDSKVAVFVDLFRTHRELVRQSVRTREAERRRDLAEAQNRILELSRSNSQLEQFAFAASHDLREPMRMIASYVQLLDERYRGTFDESATRWIGHALDGVTRMQAMMDGLMEVARVGGADEAMEPTSTATAFDDALRSLSVAVEESQGVVSRGPLPTVLASRVNMVQVFQNLLGNALKFRSEVPPHVHATARRDGALWHITIQDNGIGIDPRDADRAFRIFQRLHTRAEFPGTGLGLSLVCTAVRSWGGEVRFEPAPVQGSRFIVSLPCLSPDEEPT
jgi:signal transduction histidine kinase